MIDSRVRAVRIFSASGIRLATLIRDGDAMSAIVSRSGVAAFFRVYDARDCAFASGEIDTYEAEAAMSMDNVNIATGQTINMNNLVIVENPDAQFACA